MNTKTMVAVILVALGIVVLAYSGIAFKTPGKPVNVLGMHFEPQRGILSRPLSERSRSRAGSCCSL